MTTDKEKIIILGGGGHAKVLIEIIRSGGIFEIAGILDARFEKGLKISGVPVIGKDDLLPGIFERDRIINACIGVGSTRDNSLRRALYEKVKQIGFSVPSLVHPKAVVSASCRISEGTQLMASSVVQPCSFIGENTIINTGAIIDHDCNVGRHVHICPGAVLSGECLVGEGSFIGTGATIVNGIKIGKNVTIGAGSVVVNDIADDSVVKGVPAR
ncbi:MAG: acetyltransferase [Nitrospiraceae bacterium]|nr:MAG: acetyltransferase [Nitrospiraceae bacterium]